MECLSALLTPPIAAFAELLGELVAGDGVADHIYWNPSSIMRSLSTESTRV
jgi:hypothetical protein